MKKFSALFVCLAFLGIYAVSAQQKAITGKVTSSDDGMELPGVSVSVKGTTIGTITSVEGTYSLDVPEDALVLVYSFVGMRTMEQEIGARTVIDVVMEPDIIGVDEVIVTALGISREKKSLGYSVQEVDGEELNRVKNENIVNSMSGKVAGVQVKANTNMGGSSNIVIRGSSSLMGNNQALFVIDGIPVNNDIQNNLGQTEGRSGYDYGNPTSDLNPNDIESMSVLKGAAATALYGSRAANGVIIITTKKGKKASDGKMFNVGINSTTMFSTMDKSTFPKYQKQYGAGYGPYYSGSDYPGLYSYDFDGDGEDDYVVPTTEDASMGSAFNPDLMVYQYDAFFPESPTYMQKSPYIAGENGPDYFFSTGTSLTNSVDVSGATDYSNFRLSYTNTDQTGMIPNQTLQKNNYNFNASFKIIDDLKVSASANYINTKTKGRNSTGYSDNIMSMFRQWYNLGVDIKEQEELYNLTGKNISWNPHDESDLTPIYWDNPYWARYQNYQNDERNRLIGYTQVDWNITSYLSLMGRASIDTYTTLQEERKAVGSVAGEFGVTRPDAGSGYSRNTISFSETNLDGMLKFNKDIAAGLNLNALLGINMRRSIFDRVYASTNGGLAVPGLYSLNNSASPMLPPEEDYEQIGVDGVYLSASIGYNNLVFVDGTVRRDVSSTLPTENNAYVYPSVSTSFIFSNLMDASWLDLGKLRLNYAMVGNDAPWGSVLDSYRINAPFSGNPMVRMTKFKNNEILKPELSNSVEGGLDMAFFGGRVGFDFALYQTNTKNQIVPLATSRAIGFESKYVNIGEIQNQGVELALRGTAVKSSDFKWDVTLNWAKNTNEVVSLGDEIQNLQLASLQGGITINAREGEPYGVIQGTDYVYHEGEKVIGADGYYAKTGTSDQILGNVNPDWNAGLTNTLNYKGVSLSFLFDMQMGGQLFSLDQWYGMGTGLYEESAFTNDLGNPVRNSIADGGGLILPGVVENADGTYSTNTTRVPGDDYRVFGWSRNPNAGFIYNATYLKLRELSLSYSLPRNVLDKTPFNNATFSVLASNLWILYKELPHADPEASQGAGNIQGWQSGVFPTARNIGFSINLQF